MQDEGHTEVWNVSGPIATLSARIVHDDWKPTGQWLIGQVRYMQRELDWIHEGKVDGCAGFGSGRRSCQ